MKYSFTEWNNRTGKIPVTWNTADYETLPWYRNPDRVKGFKTEGKNYECSLDLNIYLLTYMNTMS